MSSASGTNTTSPGRAPTIAATQPGWRFWAELGVWVVVVAGFVLGLMNFWRMLAVGLGVALGGAPDVDAQVEVWWTYVGIGAGLAVVAVVAAVARRWAAFVLALLVAAACAYFAAGLFPSVQPEVAPVAPVEQVDQGPPPCACYSGSVCDCPGG